MTDATEMDVSSLLVAEPAAPTPTVEEPEPFNEPTAVVPEPAATLESEVGTLQAEEEGHDEADAPAPEEPTPETEPEPEAPQTEEEEHDEADATAPEEPAPEAEPEPEAPQAEEEENGEADVPAPEERSTNETGPEAEEIHEFPQDAGSEATEEDKAMGLKDKLLARKEAPVAQEGAARPRGGVLLPLLTLLLLAAVVLCWLQLRSLTTILRADRTSEAKAAASAGTLQQDERYEYAIDFLLDDRITAGMDERGRAGWKVVGSRRTQDSTTGQYGYEFIFMRSAQKE